MGKKTVLKTENFPCSTIFISRKPNKSNQSIIFYYVTKIRTINTQEDQLSDFVAEGRLEGLQSDLPVFESSSHLTFVWLIVVAK